MRFVMLPTKWIQDGGLAEFGQADVPALKAYFGLAILRGRYEREHEVVSWFPASLSQIAAAGHLSRNAAHEGVRGLLARGIIKRRENAGWSFGVQARTAAFRFTGGTDRYFTFPYEHIARRSLLEHLRRGRRALAALQVYLLLGAFRDNASGMSSIKYSTMVSYGVPRDAIHAGLMLLYQATLVARMEPNPKRPYLHYFIVGIRPLPAANRQYDPATSAAYSPAASVSSAPRK